MSTDGKRSLSANMIIRPAVATGLVLLFVVLAVHFNWQLPDPGSEPSAPNWTVFDFVAMGVLVFGAGLVIEFLVLKIRDRQKLAVAIILLLVVFVLIVAELAVGLFGTPFAGS